MTTPSTATHIRGFAINGRNHWFIADRSSGFWKSTDQGNSWTPINNSGIPACGWTIDYDTFHSQLIAGVFVGDNSQCTVSFWRSTNEGASWVQIPYNVTTFSLNPSHTGPSIDPNGLINFGGRDASGGTISSCGSWWSSDGGVTTNPISVNQGCFGSWSWFYNPITRDYWFGTEAGGVYRGIDGKSFTNVFQFPPAPGNVDGIIYDSSGNVLVAGRSSATGRQGIWKSSGSNGNYTWTQVFQSPGSGRALFRDLNGLLYYGQQDSGGSSTVAVYRSLDQGATWNQWTTGIPAAQNGSNLEAWHFVYNSTDRKLYTNVQDGATNSGWVYSTTNAIY